MRYFVVRGFGTKKDSQGREFDFEKVDRELIAPALLRCGFAGGTTAQMKDAGSIQADMFELILEADVVVCDITVHNANVFYELGIRHSLRKRHTVMIKGQPSADVTPFDIGGFRYLSYPADDPGSQVEQLAAAVKAGLDNERDTDSPVFLTMATLPEARPPNKVPSSFTQEVQRARAAEDKGWLLMLADDVRQQRFEWDGLRAVAAAQWKLKDYDTARVNWERLLEHLGDDTEALLALANIYQRLYVLHKDVSLIKSSDQCIDTLLAASALAAKDRAEALSLRARNLKTLWREEILGATDIQSRLMLACDRRLLKSHQAYREAFEIDLNACFPGIAGLQSLAILLELAESPHWETMFDSEDAAADEKKALQRAWAELVPVVKASIRCAIKRSEGTDIWANISKADLLFLTEDKAQQAAGPERLIKAYRDAVPPGDSFEWDAVRGQLELFDLLGIRSTAAQAVIAQLQPKQTRRTQVIVFAGHTIDAPGRPTPRFPAQAEQRARELIAAALKAHQRDGVDLVVLASAAPGADILAHEVCHELGIRSVVCLPMPKDDVVRAAFANLDGGWRNRLLEILERPGVRLRVLQAEAQLPRWLRQRAPDPWERGNRWMIRTAQAWDAERRTLLALWDGDDAGGATGGTAHVWRLARDAGLFTEQIDSRQLLS